MRLRQDGEQNAHHHFWNTLTNSTHEATTNHLLHTRSNINIIFSNKAVIITSCMQNRANPAFRSQRNPKKKSREEVSVNREDRREKKEEHLKRVAKNKFILYLIITHSLALALGKLGGSGSLQGHKRANLNLRMSEILILSHLPLYWIIFSYYNSVFLVSVRVHRLDKGCEKGNWEYELDTLHMQIPHFVDAMLRYAAYSTIISPLRYCHVHVLSSSSILLRRQPSSQATPHHQP